MFFVDSVFFHLGSITFKWNYACLERLAAHPDNLFFVNSFNTLLQLQLSSGALRATRRHQRL